MANTYFQKELTAEGHPLGIRFIGVNESRFKLGSISVSLVMPLEKGKTGARALVPYLLKCSSRLHGTSAELNRELAMLYGAELGVSVQRLGDMQQIIMSITFLDDRYTIGGEKLSSQCAKLLCDVLFDSIRFRDEDIEREKRLLIEQIEAERNDKLGYSIEQCIKNAGLGEPMGIDPKGTPEEIEALTTNDLIDAAADMTLYAKKDIVAVGMFDFNSVARTFCDMFADIARDPVNIELPAQVITGSGAGRSVTERVPVTQTNLVQLMRLPADIDEYSARLMATCLGGSVSSLFFKHIREELSLCYYCSAAYVRSKHMLMIYSGLSDDKLSQAADEIKAQIAVAADGRLTSEDIEAARLALTDGYRQVYDSVGAVAGWYLGRVLDAEPDTPEQAAERIAAVTADDIAAAAKALSPDVTFTLRPEASPEDVPASETSEFSDGINAPVQDSAEEYDGFTRHTVRRLGECYYEKKHPTGVTIYVYPRPQSDGVYAMFGARAGSVDDNFVPYGESEAVVVPNGIAHFLEHKLFESEELGAFERYAKTGANANAYTSFDRTVYLFSCSANFEQSFEILLDFVQSPYFTEQTVAKEQGIIGQEISMYDNDPSWVIMLNMLDAMYQKDHIRYSIAGSAESISHITADMLYQCYNAFYHPENMAICVAGNVTPAQVSELCDRLLKPSDRHSPTRLVPDEPDEVLKDYVEQDMDVAAPLFMLGFKDTAPHMDEGVIKQSVLGAIALGSFIGKYSALYDRLLNDGLINESFGTEYYMIRTASASLISGESSEPVRVRELINAELERVAREGLDAETFECARRDIYGTMISGLNTNAGIASDLMDAFITGGTIDDRIDFAASVTKEQAEAFLRERLVPERSVLSVIKPIKQIRNSEPRIPN